MDPRRVDAVDIKTLLDPLGAIDDSSLFLGSIGAPRVGLQCRQPGEGYVVSKAGEVTQLRRSWLSILARDDRS